MLFAVCRDTNRRHFNNRWLPAPVPNEPETPQLALPPPTCAAADPAAAAADPATAAPKTCAPAPARAARTSSCFAGAGPGGNKTAAGGGGDAPPLALVGSHAIGAVFPKFGEYVYVLWHRVCAYCGLVCRERAEGAPYVLGDGVDLLLDPHWSLPLDNPTLEKIPHRFVFYSWDPGKLGRYFHFNGNLLETGRADRGDPRAGEAADRVVAEHPREPGDAICEAASSTRGGARSPTSGCPRRRSRRSWTRRSPSWRRTGRATSSTT